MSRDEGARGGAGPGQVRVAAFVDGRQLTRALRAAVVDNEDFNFRFWDDYDADIMERAARRIRHGLEAMRAGLLAWEESEAGRGPGRADGGDLLTWDDLVRTPGGTVPAGYLRHPTEARRCKGCGQWAVGHLAGEDLYCCECHVRRERCPADWHPECMRAYRELEAADAAGGPTGPPPTPPTPEDRS